MEPCIELGQQLEKPDDVGGCRRDDLGCHDAGRSGVRRRVDRSHFHRTAWASAECTTPWLRRTDAGPSGRPPGTPRFRNRA
ncbi:MAG: hypothetical protein M3357_07270 [Actinomycetota bacterium]|nr:hypothetical protein [Actinomycetota bacterium]